MINAFSDILDLLKGGGISSPRLEATMLTEFVGQGKPFEAFSIAEKQKIAELISERLSQKPLCKIIGSKGFYKYDFFVSEDVLSPRPDTEVLVEKAVSYLEKDENKSPKILELGLGSGCILLSILGEFSEGKGTGLEFSEKAIEVAKKNILLLNQETNVEVVHGSWFDEDLSCKLKNEKFDLIVSNPPYIPTHDVEELAFEVKHFDPLLALDGGSDGLRDYRQIAKISDAFLEMNGYLFLEIGIGQANDVVEIFENQGFNLLEIVKDLAGIERCIIFKK